MLNVSRLTLCALILVPLTFRVALCQQTGGPSPKGAAIFSRRCAKCHGEMGQGRTAVVSLVAPSLQAEHNPGMVMKAVETGPSHMPSFARVLSVEDMRTVSYYVSQHIATIPLTGGNLSEGGSLFRSYCAACHRTAARGGALAFADANAPALTGKSAALIAGTVRSGAGPMPSFPATDISDQQLASIVEYVKFIQRPPNPGGTPLGYYGPVAEGFFVWIGVLVLVLCAMWIERGGKG